MADSINFKKSYHRNWYINKRDYILSLSKIPRKDLDNYQQFDLDKHFKRFGPKSSSRFGRILITDSIVRGEESNYLKKKIGKVIVTFN